MNEEAPGGITSEEFVFLGQEEQVARLGDLANAALAEFGIRAESIRPLHHAENTTFFVNSPRGRFCLRISRPGYHTRTQIEGEIAFLSALRDEGFNVPDPWQDRIVSASTALVPEPRDCVLLGWLDGEFAEPTFSPRQGRLLGRTMAAMHGFARSWSPPAGFTRHTMFAFEGHASDTPDYMAVDEDRRLVSAVYAETREILAALSRNPDSWGLIHGDLYHWNVLFEGDQVNVIDFDDTQWGFWLADLATALADVMSSETYEDVRASLLAGYEEVSPLPPRTNELLDIFLQARLASVAAWVMSRTAIPAFRESGHEWVASLCRRIRRLR